MNYFILDNDIKKCARYHDNSRVNKMVVESSQMLSMAIRVLTGYEEEDIDKMSKTHIHHPLTKWVISSSSSFLNLYSFSLELAQEYTRRYGKIHSSVIKIKRCFELYDEKYFKNEKKDFVLCMPEEFQNKTDVVNSYRRFFSSKPLIRYDHSDIPNWFMEFRKLPFFVSFKLDKRGKRVYTKCSIENNKLVKHG